MRNGGLGSWSARRARMTPNRTALEHEGSPVTYARLHQRVCKLANALRSLGVRFGDRVAYLGPNHPSYVESLVACGMLGAVFVPINWRLTASEIEYVLADSGATTLLFAPTQATLVHELDAVPQRIALANPTDGEHDYEALIANTAETVIDETVPLDATCLIMYTSGSTGKPKGAVLTHGNLTWNSINVLVETDFAGDEVGLVVAPLFHIAALGMVTLPMLLKGASVVLQSAFDPAAVLDLVERRGVTVMFGVPTMYQAMAAHPRFDDTDLSSVRTLLCGGSAVPKDLIQRYSDRGLTFVQGYGMTETSPGALLVDREHVTSKLGSAGVPSFFTDVQVVHEDMTPVKPGEKGEVVISGPNVMRGYWGKPEATAEVLRDGWFHSGDVATVDEDGYSFIVDRLKDVIISGGENIYPAEVEQALYGHPDVQLCAVIGVPHEKWGEVGKAVVVLADGARGDESELLAFLEPRLARYKLPTSIVFTDALPTTGSGKLLKSQIRQHFGA
jgi:fatty-acyl-CoA synthase